MSDQQEYTEFGILLTPPTFDEATSIRFAEEAQPRMLLVYGSIQYLVLDAADFELIKDARVWLRGGQIEMENGSTVEAFLGIPGHRIAAAPKFDYRRMWYIVREAEWPVLID